MYKKICSHILISCLFCITLLAPIQKTQAGFGVDPSIEIHAASEFEDTHSKLTIANYFFSLAGLYGTLTLDNNLIITTFMGYSLLNFLYVAREEI